MLSVMLCTYSHPIYSVYVAVLREEKKSSTQLSWLISGVNKAEAKVVLPFRVNTVAKNLE